MKAHIGFDADSGLVHTVTTTAANKADVEQVANLLHGKEEQVWADSGYRSAQTRVRSDDLQWHIAARPSDIAKLRTHVCLTTSAQDYGANPDACRALGQALPAAQGPLSTAAKMIIRSSDAR